MIRLFMAVSTILLRMTWKVYACPKRMHRPGINGEGELREAKGVF